MTRKNTLNNLQLGNARKNQVYQAVITDLAIEGIIPLGTAESLLGYEIPEYLHVPDGKAVSRDKPQQKGASKKKGAAQAEQPAGGVTHERVY